MKKKVYLIDLEDSKTVNLDTTDERWKAVSEEQRNAYSLDGFANAYNLDEISTENTWIRIL